VTRCVGVGRLLVDGVRDYAIAHDVDTLKVAVMVGNSRARDFYIKNGFRAGEEVLYMKL
jgi:ribosomal protein S18 acetylase RimI-like enzyme